MEKKVKTLKEYLDENCSIPKTELDALKAKYGKIKIITVVVEEPVRDDDGNVVSAEVYYYAARRPDKGQVRMLMDFANKKNEDKFISSAIKNLIVGGDMEALENDGLVYMGIIPQIQGLLKPYQSFLTKA